MIGWHQGSLLAMALVLAGCGGRAELLPALTDDSTCEEAVAVVEEAVSQARTYIGTEGDDPARADQLVFALSAVDERPECVDTDLASQARGLRTTLNGAPG